MYLRLVPFFKCCLRAAKRFYLCVHFVCSSVDHQSLDWSSPKRTTGRVDRSSNKGRDQTDDGWVLAKKRGKMAFIPLIYCFFSASIASRFYIWLFFLTFFASSIVEKMYCLNQSKLSNYVQIIQFCPNYPIFKNRSRSYIKYFNLVLDLSLATIFHPFWRAQIQPKLF